MQILRHSKNRIYLGKLGKVTFYNNRCRLDFLSVYLRYFVCSAVMKMKSAEVKEKLVEYITNPNLSSNNDIDRHVSSSDKLGKPYRNLTPIFSIDEDHEPNGNPVHLYNIFINEHSKSRDVAY